MSTPKFTRGPWNVCATDAREIISMDDVLVATVDDYEKSDEVMLANGDMLAAAPQMYEALKALYLEVSSQWYPLTIAEQVEAALAKAEGRKP